MQFFFLTEAVILSDVAPSAGNGGNNNSTFFFFLILHNKSTTHQVRITAPEQQQILWVSVFKHSFGSGSDLFWTCACRVV